MTPEAVIDRYLETASRQPLDGDAFVELLGTDADLLSRWLLLLGRPAEPEPFRAALSALTPSQVYDLAASQALALVSVPGSARLAFEQWQSVLRDSLVAELLAAEVGLPDPLAVRWRVLLAASGMRLPHDPLLVEMLTFRGVRAELLEDASPVHRLFAVVEALDPDDPGAAEEAAGQLLGMESARFQGLLATADGRCQALLERLRLDADRTAEASERLWLRLQVGVLGHLLENTAASSALLAAHELVSRRLFGAVPRLFLAAEGGQLAPLDEGGPTIALGSRSSSIARSARLAERTPFADQPDQGVADRQVLRGLGADEAVAYPLADADGAVRGVLVFPVDEDVDQETAMALYAEELSRRLVPLAAPGAPAGDDLARYRQREERRLREVVHEANNPLSIVNNYLHILELKLGHDSHAVDQLKLIGRELDRAGEIIRRARDLPDLEERPDAALELAPLDLNALVRRAVEVHLGYAGEHRVSLVESMVPGELVVRSDEQRVAQILSNLLRNAVEAAPGGTVTVSTASGVFRSGREGVVLGVADTGAGLPRDVLARLTEPKQSTKGGDHSGLGLHIVHRLVAELGGSIDVRTTAGHGTTFSVFLPLDPDPTPQH